MTYEYAISVEEWIERFPLESHRDAVSDISYLSGPFDLAIIAQLWQKSRQSTNAYTDVFVFNRGEPDCRHVTKIGGLPYRPADQPWPTCNGAPDGTHPSNIEYYQPPGTPMSFLAQFSFASSGDLVGELPGDVLLIFAEDDSFGTDVHFEWYSFGLSDLVSPKQVPAGASTFNTSYWYICRLQEPDRKLQDDSFVSMTKIGGTPNFIQGESSSAGRFLCQLSSMQPTFKRPYPWIDQASPIIEFKELHSNELCMVDMGNLYIFIDEFGTCSSQFDTY